MDGKETIVLSQKTPLRNSQGLVVGVLGISIDINDRKKMEADLLEAMIAAEAASRAKSEFMANMSHDFATPLTGIIHMSTILKNKLPTSDGVQEAQWLKESGEQLLELCNGILQSVSADNYTEQDLRAECFHLLQFIEGIYQLERPMLRAKGLQFKIDIDENIPTYLISDRMKLHRILLNLLGNAIKFTQTGFVSLSMQCLEKTTDTVVISFKVIDTGRGVAPEVQDKIFERFFLVNPTYKGVDHGYGLGLHIAQKYVRLLGGTEITVDSCEGKGSCFSFELPCKIGEAKDAVPLENLAAAETSTKSTPKSSLPDLETGTVPKSAPLLLLIEDFPAALRGLEAIVTGAGCRFQSAIDGESGLELATHNEYDLIITDVGLPGISGIEVTEQVRASERSKQKKRIPIVALTGHAVHTAEAECYQAGMDKVLTKPTSIDTIKKLIQELVAKPEPTSPEITPPMEEYLFLLEHFPLFDMAMVKEIFGANCYVTIPGILEELSNLIPKDKAELKLAFENQDWERIAELAHRTKGGAATCGTVRLHYACQYLERYKKAGYAQSLKKLYHQLIIVMDETKDYIDKWLEITRAV